MVLWHIDGAVISCSIRSAQSNLDPACWAPDLPLHCLDGSTKVARCVMQGSVTQGKGRKLSGFDAVRFRNAIMRQTGFIEADTRDR